MNFIHVFSFTVIVCILCCVRMGHTQFLDLPAGEMATELGISFVSDMRIISVQ